ncbi:Ig-like domain-containing protein, partial [Weissella sp. MSCH1]|uniref:Ig-like domain-containing protein n=1 Tax=Weissella sp. MSCH1 TaxID=3383343 RepID=UPI003896EA2E
AITPSQPTTEGEAITATPTDKDGNQGTATTDKVGKPDFVADEHKPTIDPMKPGSEPITGTGTRGDTIVLTDKDGKTIGTGTVGDHGKYAITPSRPTTEGEAITATPTDKDGNQGTAATDKVGKPDFVADEHKPTIDPMKPGSNPITGSGKINSAFSKDGELPNTGVDKTEFITVLGAIMLFITIILGMLFTSKNKDNN